MISINHERGPISTESSEEKACTNVYQALVAKRKNIKHWTMPKIISMHVSKIVEFVSNTDYRISTYLEAQFYFLDSGFCRKAFNLPYPPLGAIINQKSLKRCERYSVYVESLKVQGFDSVRRDHKIKSEFENFKIHCVKKSSLLHIDNFRNMVMSDAISLYCLALIKYLMPRYTREVEEMYDFLDYMERYTLDKRIWDKCTEYITKKERSEWLKV